MASPAEEATSSSCPQLKTLKSKIGSQIFAFKTITALTKLSPAVFIKNIEDLVGRVEGIENEREILAQIYREKNPQAFLPSKSSAVSSVQPVQPGASKSTEQKVMVPETPIVIKKRRGCPKGSINKGDKGQVTMNNRKKFKIKAPPPPPPSSSSSYAYPAGQVQVVPESGKKKRGRPSKKVKFEEGAKIIKKDDDESKEDEVIINFQNAFQNFDLEQCVSSVVNLERFLSLSEAEQLKQMERKGARESRLKELITMSKKSVQVAKRRVKTFKKSVEIFHNAKKKLEEKIEMEIPMTKMFVFRMLKGPLNLNEFLLSPQSTQSMGENTEIVTQKIDLPPTTTTSTCVSTTMDDEIVAEKVDDSPSMVLENDEVQMIPSPIEIDVDPSPPELTPNLSPELTSNPSPESSTSLPPELSPNVHPDCDKLVEENDQKFIEPIQKTETKSGDLPIADLPLDLDPVPEVQVVATEVTKMATPVPFSVVQFGPPSDSLLLSEDCFYKLEPSYSSLVTRVDSSTTSDQNFDPNELIDKVYFDLKQLQMDKLEGPATTNNNNINNFSSTALINSQLHSSGTLMRVDHELYPLMTMVGAQGQILGTDPHHNTNTTTEVMVIDQQHHDDDDLSTARILGHIDTVANYEEVVSHYGSDDSDDYDDDDSDDDGRDDDPSPDFEPIPAPRDDEMASWCEVIEEQADLFDDDDYANATTDESDNEYSPGLAKNIDVNPPPPLPPALLPLPPKTGKRGRKPKTKLSDHNDPQNGDRILHSKIDQNGTMDQKKKRGRRPSSMGPEKKIPKTNKTRKRTSKHSETSEEGRLLCVICDKHFKNRNVLYNHRSIYHRPEGGRISK